MAAPTRCKRQENPCQRGAVHTWHSATLPPCAASLLSGTSLTCSASDPTAGSLRVGADVLRQHQPGIVAKQSEPAAQMMGTDTGLHADRACRHVGQPCLHLAARPLLPQRDGATPIEADDVKRVLADIDTDRRDHTVMLSRHGVL